MKFKFLNIVLLGLCLISCIWQPLFAQSIFEDSIQKRLKKSSPTEKIELLSKLPYEAVTSYSVFLENYFLEGISTAKALKNKEIEAELYHQLSLCYAYQGIFDKRLKYSLKAIALYDQLGNENKVGNLYTFLGFSMKTRNTKKAKEYMIKGIKILEKENDMFALNGAYDNYGVVQEISGDLDSAIYYYNKALSIKVDQADSLGIPYALGHLAGAYSKKSEFSKAKSYLDRAMEIRLKRNDLIGIAETNGQYGEFYFLQKNYQKAMPYLLKSNDLAQKTHYLHLQHQSIALLSKCYEELGDFKNALKYQKVQENLKDSMLNESTNNSIASLEIQFETEKKEKQLAEQKATIAHQELVEKKRNFYLIGLALLVLFSILFGRYFYVQQKFKQRKLVEENKLKDELAKSRLENELHQERTRISKDLHDNIGSHLTFIISSVDNMRYLPQAEDKKLQEKLSNVSTFGRTTINHLRDTVWALNQDEISLEDLKSRIQDHLQMAVIAQDSVDLEFDVQAQNSISFNALQGVNIYRIVQEAMNNALKYAQAKHIKIQFEQTNSVFKISISDDGSGFDLNNGKRGNGLENMKNRALTIGADFKISSEPQKGTVVLVMLKNHQLKNN